MTRSHFLRGFQLFTLIWALGAFHHAAMGNTVNVTISCTGPGNVNPKGTQTIGANTDLTVTATPNAGCELFDWYIDGKRAGWEITVETLHLGDLDMDVNVVFQRITNQVHTFAGSGGTITPDASTTPQLVAWGDGLTFVAAPDPGYHVLTWSLDGQIAQTGGNAFTLGNVVAEHWMEVAFAPDVYSVHASANSHGSLSPNGTQQAAYGDDLSFTATPNTGYDVVVWSLDGRPVLTNQIAFTLSKIASDHTLQVAFSAPKLAIALTSADKVMVSWTDAISTYTLQETSVLGTAWTNSVVRPVESAGCQQVVLPPSAVTRFYRLAQP